MSMFKCKMCGGTLEIQENASVAVCEYCGTPQTLPKLSDDRRANLYDRANHFRRNNDFDKAMGIYEQILNDDPSDAEAYWSIVLCRYGIEYVEDPSTHKRVPTINRAQFTSVFDDDNYKSALQYADGSQRGIYEAEAKAINEIHKGILEISQKEEPFDVFICYKETDNNGRRTPDSVLATELYHELTREGFKVFFSRITLEDKLGVAYEPYIFAALNSSKVMVALGTKPEYFNAVWVKNEWSRYLALIKNGARKILIPAYRDMDPYDLPEEFAHLQAQDMSKLGFMQDLIRGIKKIVDAEAPKPVVQETVVVQQSAVSSNIVALVKRGNMALEDGEWEKADGFFEEVLNLDAECAEAYLGKTLAAERCDTIDTFIQKRLQRIESAEYKQFPIDTNPERAKAAAEKYLVPNYLSKENIRRFYENNPSYANCIDSRKAQKAEEERWWSEHKQLSRAMRFASGDFAKNMKSACAELLKKLNERIAAAEAESAENKAAGEKKYSDFLDAADAKAAKQYETACANREKDYQELCRHMEKATDANTYDNAAQYCIKLLDYKDSKERLEICKQKASEWRAKQERRKAERIAAEEAEKERRRIQEEQERTKKKAKAKKVTIIAAVIAVVIVAAALLTTMVIIPNGKYNDALALMESGKYEDAISAFEALGGYKDSDDKISDCKYIHADTLMETGNYDEAMSVFEALGGYKDSDDKINECTTAILDSKYNEAVALMEAGEYEKAISVFTELNGHKDSSTKISECNTLILDGKYNEAVALMEAEEYVEAISAFEALGGHKDSKEKIIECTAAILDSKYNEALAFMEAGDYRKALACFDAADNYKDATVCAAELRSQLAEREIISAGGHDTIGLKSDGTVVVVGWNKYFLNYASEWTNIVAVGAGYDYIVGLRYDGTVMAVGDNDYGQCDVSNWTDIVAISAGNYHTVGLKSDGTVVAVGDNSEGQCDVSNWTDIVAVSAGAFHTVGLKSDGTVVAVGDNYSGQCNVDDWTDIVAISAGFAHTVGLKSDGTVVAVGDNYYGECDVANWTDIVAVSAGEYYTVGLKSDGTVVAVGYNNYGQCDVTKWTDIVDISAGFGDTFGLTSDGTVVTTGANFNGTGNVWNWNNIMFPSN